MIQTHSNRFGSHQFMLEKHDAEVQAVLGWSAKIEAERLRANKWMAAAILGWFFALGIAWAWWMWR